MNKKNFMVLIIIILLVIVILLGTICIKQNDDIQRYKIQSLNRAFYYTQEVIQAESETNYKNWGNRAANIYIMQEYTTGENSKMGDYDEISKLLLEVSKIEDPTSEDSAKLLDRVKQMKISWNTNKGEWAAKIIN